MYQAEPKRPSTPENLDQRSLVSSDEGAADVISTSSATSRPKVHAEPDLHSSSSSGSLEVSPKNGAFQPRPKPRKNIPVLEALNDASRQSSGYKTSSDNEWAEEELSHQQSRYKLQK